MLLCQRSLACRRFLLAVSTQRQPNRASGVGGFSLISTLLPVRNIQFHGVALLSNLYALNSISGSFPSPKSGRTDGMKDILGMGTANASGISKNARKKQVKKETGLSLTSKKDKSFGEWYSEKICILFLDILGLTNVSGISKNARKKQVKKETGLSLNSKKDESFGEWYSEVVVNSGLIEYHGFFGFSVLPPWAMTIWKNMQTFFDAEIQKMDIENIYFPMFVNENVLQKENDHIEHFAPEVACAAKLGQNDLEEIFAIRCTNETNVYSCFSKWISTHQDLPLKLNQWCNHVPWENRHATPFIRSQEFLWQDGYAAFATKEEADNQILEILELYRRIYEEYLAIPVVKGRKSVLEKIAGGLYTTSIEAFIPNTGRGVQGATAHCLGQNFAEKFEIDFVNEKGEKCMAYQNFWTYNSSTIGVMVLVHGDDKGLVIPPKVADIQIIIIPVPYKDSDLKAISAACSSAVQILRAAGFRAEHDFRDNYSPGWKYSNWEMKGVPLRIEISPEDIANNQVRIMRRDTGSKSDVPTTNLVEHVQDLLSNIHESMLNAAKVKRDACKMIVYTWEEFMTALDDKKLILAPWCDEEDVEEDVKARMEGKLGAAKILCSPFDQPSLPKGTLCFASGKLAKTWTYWGRSY